MKLKLGRRSFLSALGAIGFSSFGSDKLNAFGLKGETHSEPNTGKVDGNAIVPIKNGFGSTGDIYAELGVVPMMNTNEIITVIGGSLMKPEVMEVMRMGNQHFCFLDELEVAAGKYIARICKSPAGYTGLVTAGAAAAILVGYAAMMTEDYEPRLEAIPDLSGFPRTEIIIQQAHRNTFDHQIRQLGAKLVVVKTREEMIAAINPRTVAIHFTNVEANNGQVSGPETVAIAKAHNIYTFCDAAADVPPKSRLWEYPAIGFDMVTFSGGKDIGGPASTGILIGKEQLIRWALLNMSPQEDRVGRPCKVGKEQIFALVKALDMFVNRDEDAILRMYDARAQVITDALARFGVTAEPRTYDPEARGNVTPQYSWRWDPAKINLTRQQVQEQLFATKPVAIGYIIPSSYDPDNGSAGLSGRPDRNWPPLDPTRYGAPDCSPCAPPNPSSFSFTFWQVKDGETEMIAKRLVEIFSAAAKA